MFDFNKVKEAAQNYEKDMTAFLRAIVKNPGESCGEKEHIDTIAAEMKKVGFDEVVIDPQGNRRQNHRLRRTHRHGRYRQHRQLEFRPL